MIVYTIIMFAVAIAFVMFAILIPKGNTNLINCYHEDRVKDKPIYGKKFSQSLWLLAAASVSSGAVGLLGETDTVTLSAISVLIIGMICGLSRLFCTE